jgi:hypothetical protein
MGQTSSEASCGGSNDAAASSLSAALGGRQSPAKPGVHAACGGLRAGILFRIGESISVARLYSSRSAVMSALEKHDSY